MTIPRMNTARSTLCLRIAATDPEKSCHSPAGLVPAPIPAGQGVEAVAAKAGDVGIGQVRPAPYRPHANHRLRSIDNPLNSQRCSSPALGGGLDETPE